MGNEMPGVSLRGMRAWWTGVQAMKELTRGPNLARVQGAREGFPEETMGQLSRCLKSDINPISQVKKQRL